MTIEPPTVDVVQVQLFRHDEIASTWAAELSCVRDGESLVGSIDISIAAPLLEVTAVRDTNGNDVAMDRLWRFAPSSDNEWTTGDGAAAIAAALNLDRDRLYGTCYTAPNLIEPGQQFVAVMLLENLHLTQVANLPGVSVYPIHSPALSQGVAVTLVEALQRLGLPAPDETLTRSAGVHGAAAIAVVQAIFANDVDAATHVAAGIFHRLVPVMTLLRGDTPKLLATAMARADAGCGEVLRFEGHQRGYRGNLLGGFISGEDPHELISTWNALDGAPRTQLWASLYSDSIAGAQWDVVIFRLFGVMEVIGRQIVTTVRDVLDDLGHPIIDSGNPVTTEHARGLVYETIREMARLTSQPTSNFAANAGGGGQFDLWSEVGLWKDIRNHVAHEGTWSNPGTRPQMRARVEAALKARGFDGSIHAGADATRRALKHAVEGALQLALHGPWRA